jgi:hypothetical protein
VADILNTDKIDIDISMRSSEKYIVIYHDNNKYNNNNNNNC